MSTTTGPASVQWYRPTELPIDPFGTADRGFGSFRVTSPYGDRSDPLTPGRIVFHDGNDLGNGRLGDKLIAPVAGKVIAAGDLRMPWSMPKPTDAAWASWGGDPARRPSLWRGSGYAGLGVVIQAGSSCIVEIAHMQEVDVVTGDVVKIGDPIGTVGETGSAYHAGHAHLTLIQVTLEAVLALGRVDGRQMTQDAWPFIAPFAGPDAQPPGAVEAACEWHARMLAQLPKRIVIPKGAETYLYPGAPGVLVEKDAPRALVGELNEGASFWAYVGYPGGLRLVRKSAVPKANISGALVVPSPAPPPDPAAVRIEAAMPHLLESSAALATGTALLEGKEAPNP